MIWKERASSTRVYVVPPCFSKETYHIGGPYAVLALVQSVEQGQSSPSCSFHLMTKDSGYALDVKIRKLDYQI